MAYLRSGVHVWCSTHVLHDRHKEKHELEVLQMLHDSTITMQDLNGPPLRGTLR